MTRCITVFFGLAFMLQLCACGSSDLDDEGRVSISLLGDGEVEVIGDDIYCTDDCEHLVKFSSAETNSTLNNTRHVIVEAHPSGDSVFLGWLASNRDIVSYDYPCDDDPVCEVVVQEICSVTLPIPLICVASSINDPELRPVTLRRDSLIDWDRSNGSLCVLQQPGSAECWQTTIKNYRYFERTPPPVLNQPVAISVAGNMACALDLTGIHCWSDQPENIILEPSSYFNLQAVDAIAVRYGYYACALSQNDVKNDVTCWQRQALAQVPELSAPENLRREDYAICVDDMGEGTGAGEKICWSNSNGTYSEWREPLQ